MNALATPGCLHCGTVLSRKSRGRPQTFCSDQCRQAHRKIPPSPENGLRYRNGRAKRKKASQHIECIVEFKPENPSLITSTPLKCERVNEVTFKVTDGELTNVPASHGQWGGYRTTKALAWIIKLRPDAWVARCGDQICNPASFKEARSQALAMARGADGDYVVEDAIRELNELQACVLPTEEDASE
jgi:hypothetical protein